MDQTEEEKQAIEQQYQKLKNSRFKQLELPAWRPTLSTKATMIVYAIFGLIFLGLGVLLFLMSKSITEIYVEYSHCEKGWCEITVPTKMEAPVYVYYQIDRFYQNHRRYVKSRSAKQIQGQYMLIDDVLQDCFGVVVNNDLHNGTQSVSRKYDMTDDLRKGQVAIPCGLGAKSYFNDEYKLTTTDGDKIEIDQSDIAWKHDVEKRFANLQNSDIYGNWDDVQWLDMADQHFIVWMTTSGLPKFRKLWGKINSELEAGVYQLKVNDNSNLTADKKAVVFTTLNDFGGKNYFLAICYIVVGCLCLISSFFKLVSFLRVRRALKKN